MKNIVKQTTNLKWKLRTLTQMQLDIEQNGGPENNGELFEERLFAMENLLKNFGLPDTQEYEKLLFVKNPPTDTDLDKMIQALEMAATEYLLTSAKTDLQILEDAVIFQLNPFNVLPELGISTHVYTIFVYNEILLLKKDSFESILMALKLAHKPNILHTLGILYNAKEFGVREKDMIQTLKNEGIKYLDLFLARASNF